MRSIDLSLLQGNVMLLHKMLFAAAAMLPLISCSKGSCPPTATCEAGVLLQDDFETENNHLYALNYTGFARWTVVEGTVDLVGTAPFDDFLPPEQGMYVDLDGSMQAAGTLQSRELFTLAPGRYRLSLMMAGMPRTNQPPNTVIISVGDAFNETVTLPSFAPLQPFVRTFRVRSLTQAHLTFEHLGGDDYGIFIDDIRFERL
jgi:hypothetical protein